MTCRDRAPTPVIIEIKKLHSQPGRKTPKGAGLGWGQAGLDCSPYGGGKPS